MVYSVIAKLFGIRLLITGTINYPEVVQDNTESPVEDETALTEVFDKTSVDSMDKKQQFSVSFPASDLCS